MHWAQCRNYWVTDIPWPALDRRSDLNYQKRPSSLNHSRCGPKSGRATWLKKQPLLSITCKLIQGLITLCRRDDPMEMMFSRIQGQGKMLPRGVLRRMNPDKIPLAVHLGRVSFGCFFQSYPHGEWQGGGGNQFTSRESELLRCF